MKHDSGSPTAWKSRREAYRKTQGPVGVPGHASTTNRFARRRARWFAAALQDVLDYRQSIHCGCDQCLPGQDRECPAREPNLVDPRD